MKRTKIMQQISCLLLILLLTLGIASTAFAADGCETTVRLSEADISGNIPFSITNMFPGDSVSKDFIIEVSHKGQSPFIIMQISAPALKSWRKY